MSNRILVFLAILACTSVIGEAVVAITRDQSQVQFATSNCQQIEVLKSAIRTTIAQSARTLGQRGSAGYTYYRANPDELKAARAQIDRELAQFTPKSCA